MWFGEKHLFSVLLLALGGASAGLCRYTVRDIGFVDLQGADYGLRLHASLELVQSRSEVLSGLDLERDSNLRFEHVIDEGPPRWGLTREGGEELLLGGLDTEAEDLGLSDVVGRVLSGRHLTELSRGALDSFAFALVIEGTSAEENRAVHALVEEAAERFELVVDQLPRPIPWPLRIVKVEASERPGEQVLLWALALDDLADDEVAMALVYGRGKLAGPVLRGENIELRELLEQLVLIGESCECDTSRAWTEEPRLPLRWDDQQRASAVAELGFDPDSPMVMGEVLRILSRGPRSEAERPLDRIESLLFGYHETDLVADALVPARGGVPNADGTPRDHERGSPRVVGAGEGDWGFADEISTVQEAERSEPQEFQKSVERRVSFLVIAGAALGGLLLLLLAVLGALLLRGRRG